jgi:hypothetical protein
MVAEKPIAWVSPPAAHLLEATGASDIGPDLSPQFAKCEDRLARSEDRQVASQLGNVAQ